MGTDRRESPDQPRETDPRETDPRAADRWQLYLATTVLAELAPGTVVDLSGPDAVLEWPFAAGVHVVTAWNPFGRPRSDTANAAAHAALVDQLDASGVRWIPASGTDAGRAYREDGVLTADLDTASALRIAGVHDQEAVFCIDAEWIEVVGVADARTERRPRLARRRDRASTAAHSSEEPLRGSRRASS